MCVKSRLSACVFFIPSDARNLARVLTSLPPGCTWDRTCVKAKWTEKRNKNRNFINNCMLSFQQIFILTVLSLMDEKKESFL